MLIIGPPECFPATHEVTWLTSIISSCPHPFSGVEVCAVECFGFVLLFFFLY